MLVISIKMNTEHKTMKYQYIKIAFGLIIQRL